MYVSLVGTQTQSPSRIRTSPGSSPASRTTPSSLIFLSFVLHSPRRRTHLPGLHPLIKISLLVFVLLAYPNPTMSSTGRTNEDLVMAIGREGSRQRGPHGSAWLQRVAKEMYPRPRASTGCWNRPWICNQVESSSSSSLSNGERQGEKRMCCRNRCVEVSSDENNCGVCGVRCPFGWQCCNGLCMHTNTNPFHCGDCFHRCHSGSLCLYGLCGYALPLPPFSFPIPFPPDHPKIPNSHPPSMPS